MNLLTPNTDQIESFYEKSKFTLAWRICLLFGAVFTILSLTFIAASTEELFIYILCSLFSISSLFYLKKTKKSNFIYFFLSIFGTVMAAYAMNNLPEIIHYGDILWLVLIIVFAFFGLGSKYGLVFLITNSSIIIYYCLITVNININSLIPLTTVGKTSLAIELIAAILSISYVIYQFLMFHNYTYKELQIQNSIISNQNKEKTTLIQEVHHRVKNNLQIIVSLLRLQKNELKSEEAKKQFTEAINRVMVMASIHQKLYKDKSFTQIVPKIYLTELTNDIITLSSNLEKVEIGIESEIKNIGLKTIVPLGLIVNELVSNSIQHAFINIEKGKININLTSDETDKIKLTYSDNGIWIEPKEEYSSFGLELISILASQLEGDYKKTNNDSGTTYVFDLKNLD